MSSIKKSKMKTLVKIASLIQVVVALELFTLGGYLLASLLFWEWMPMHPLPFQLVFLFALGVWLMWITDRGEMGFEEFYKRGSPF